MKISKSKLRQIIKEESAVLGEDSATEDVYVKIGDDFLRDKGGNWEKYEGLRGLIVGKNKQHGNAEWRYDIKWDLPDGSVEYSRNFQRELERL
jgi:hypothetical protein